MIIKYPNLFELSPEELLKLDELPGLRVNEAAATAWGTFDAINAALVRLGHPPLELADIDPPMKALSTKWLDALRAYQVVGVKWLRRRLVKLGAAMLADDTGLGKTLQAITLMDLLALQPGGRVLVVCPKPAMLTWEAEAKKWIPNDSTFIVSPATTKWDKAQEASIVVTSYDHRVLDRTIENAFDDEYPTMIVLDEFHRARGRKSLRTKKMKDILPLARYRLAATATPQWDRPRDLYSQLSLLWPASWGSQWDFDLAYCGGMNTRGSTNKGVKRPDELKARVNSLMLRRTKADVAKELPPLIRQVRWIDPTPEALRGYSAAAVGFGKASLHHALIATLKGKMEEAIELAVEAKQFLLFTWMKEHASYFARTLNMEHDTPCVLITGELSLKQRKAAIEEARTQRKGIVATLDSASESLNLQGIASTGIMHYIPHEPNKVVQAEGRLHRLGTLDTVVWNYLIMKDSADMLILNTIINKLDQWTQTMDGSRRGLRHTLGDAVDGKQAVQNEKEVLAALYAAMKS